MAICADGIPGRVDWLIRQNTPFSLTRSAAILKNKNPIYPGPPNTETGYPVMAYPNILCQGIISFPSGSAHLSSGLPVVRASMKMHDREDVDAIGFNAV